MGVVVYSDFLTIITRVENFGTEESQCRADEEKADAEKRKLAEENKKPSSNGDKYESYKSAREYCIARRAAIAGERQAAFAKGHIVIGFATLVAAIIAAAFAAKAAWATQASADEAKRSADTAEMTFRTTQAASVLVRDVLNERLLNAEKHVIGWRFRVEWENVGGAQTKGLTTWFAGTVTANKAMTADAIFGQASTPGQGVIAGRSRLRSGHVTIDRATIDHVLADQVAYFLWGWCEYNTIYTDQPRQRTEFCYRLVLDSGLLGDATFILHGGRQGQSELP